VSTDDPVTAELGYEAARAELGDVVRRLETGGQTLEESLALWRRGEELAQLCERWLSGATARLDAAIAVHDGAPAQPPGDGIPPDPSRADDPGGSS
jgi:exodeoxyribonuclease VII small subunit